MNNFQLYLSLIYGVIPYERLNLQANIFWSYLQMYVCALFYLVCFGLVRFGSFGVHKHSKCDSICRLANTLFTDLGLFLYLSTHLLTLWRRKQFFINFKNSLEDIDEHLRKCDTRGTKVEQKKQTKYMYYATWFAVVACFVATTIYDIKELLHYYHEYFFIVLIASNFPLFSCSLVLGQFIYFVSEISKRFRLLNELLERINRESDSKHAPLLIFDIESETRRDMPNKQGLRQRHNTHLITINEENDEPFEGLDDIYDYDQDSFEQER